MTCYHPIRAHRTTNGVVFSELSRNGDYVGAIEIPCGRCIGCRMRRASDWELRVMHESTLWSENCFVTLTYDDYHLPDNASLRHRDFQLFMKRLRKWRGESVRFYMCGEYGPEGGRPHYHACLFNVGFRANRKPAGKSESGEPFYNQPDLDSLWRMGFATVQDLTRGTASYTARYIMKKALGKTADSAYQVLDPETGELIQLVPEYSQMSLKPGVGAAWFRKYATDVYPNDFVIQDGIKRRPPKYYDKLLRRSKSVKMDQVEYSRQVAAKLAHEDNTDERRRAREIVHEAKIRNLKRGDM